MSRSLSTFICAVLIVLAISSMASAQKIESLNSTAKGKGTISTGVDKLTIYSVMVVLKENGEAEFTFYCDLQLTAKGRWTANDTPDQGINLEITGGVVAGNATGSGKLFLRPDGKSIDKLNIDAKSGSRTVSIKFVAAKQT
ncbi:MAG TPA: hypothetical protein VFD63_25005 [Pyrinomonadaceae bacterium]|nr:hypothetical protein [Pyrinomonadaceae bacterium]